MHGIFLKLARRNVKRSIKDFSVFFLTLAFATCLLYSFTASDDYLLALDLSEQQRGMYDSSSSIMEAFSVFSVIVFVFLVVYANRFILRRRSNEFAQYGLLGMSAGQTALILAYENCMVGIAALGVGVLVGTLISPAMTALTALVFAAPWSFIFTFEPGPALWTCGSFAIIMIGATLLSARDLRKRSLLQLMDASRTPEKPRAASRLSLNVQRSVALVVLAVIWGSCILSPMLFISMILPFGITAVIATGVLFRVWAIERARAISRHPERTLRGLRFFVIRQIEAKVSMSANAMGCVCVLLAVTICMIVAGLAFSIGLRAPGGNASLGDVLAPIVFVSIFYGMTFLVAAIAVLALQQMAEGADSIPRFRTLANLGSDQALMRRAVRQQTGIYFFVPFIFALVHCIFGLSLVGFLAVALGSSSYLIIVACTIGGTALVLCVYFAVTSRACARMLIGQTDRSLRSS